jgi:hypothetical protein
MSRFEKFQNVQVFNEDNEPLNEQIIVHDCIINFKDGFISNLHTKSETEGEKYYPAIDCIDGYIEYWENGVLENKKTPAVISADHVEFWEEGQYKGEGKFYNNINTKLHKQKGIKAEIDFAKYLNKKEIPFIHFDQPCGDLYSEVFRNKNIKRPDYLIFIDKKPLFIEVKAKSCYSINQEELEKLNNLKNEFQINVIFAITDINENEYNNFDFISLDDLTNYIEIVRNKKSTDTWNFYIYSKLLLKEEIISNNINKKRLEEIYEDYHYYEASFSDILINYFNKINFKMQPHGRAE